ncbi:MAG: dinitrogenase iron-molybdenum cofactor biosynthesis protein [Deltaproteobacteria bacterium]|nr:dinitrogenase iron-molybdenum cofactor biosynthesis protein [Deltaproteobacteria bacterium]
MKNGKIAIPSDGNGGLDGTRSNHFGHCDIFTVVEVKDGVIEKVSTLKNVEHGQGGCMVPIDLLGQHRINAIVVGGIGARPLMGFKQAGIEVYYDDKQAEIRPVVEDLIAGNLAVMADNQACGGHCH